MNNDFTIFGIIENSQEILIGVYAIFNIFHKIQRQLPSNWELLGIHINSQKFPLLFSSIPKYSQKFQGFLSLLICMSWNKL